MIDIGFMEAEQFLVCFRPFNDKTEENLLDLRWCKTIGLMNQVFPGGSFEWYLGADGIDQLPALLGTWPGQFDHSVKTGRSLAQGLIECFEAVGGGDGHDFAVFLNTIECGK